MDFDHNQKLTFTIKKDDVNGIKFMVPNKMKTTSVAGTKTWKGDKETIAQNTIKVDLLQNGKVLQHKK